VLFTKRLGVQGQLSMTGKEPSRITKRTTREPEAIAGPTLTMRLFFFEDSPKATFELPDGLSKTEQHGCRSFLDAAMQQVIDALQDANVESAVEALLETRHANALEVRFRGPVSQLSADDFGRVSLDCQVFAMADSDESEESTRSFRAFTPAGDFDVTIEVVDAQPGSPVVPAVPTATVSTEAPPSGSLADRPMADDIDYHGILQAFHSQIRQAHAPTKEELEVFLARLEGRSFGSLAENQRFAAELQQLLNALGLRVQCPTCGQPARIRCASSGRAKSGAFQFNHAGGQKVTNHGGSTKLPPLKLVPAQPPSHRKHF
jgi:hypothetical protein